MFEKRTVPKVFLSAKELERHRIYFFNFLEDRLNIIGTHGVHGSRIANYYFALASLRYFVPDKEIFKTIAMNFSPVSVKYKSRQIQNAINSNPVQPDCIFHQGALISPTIVYPPRYPYYLYTDCVCNPDDPEQYYTHRPPKVFKDFAEIQGRNLVNARMVFTMTEWARELILKVHKLDPSRVMKAGQGPSINIPDKPVSYSEKEDLIMIVGFDLIFKGIETFHDAASKVLKEYPKAKFLAVGDFPSKSFPVLENLTFTGRKGKEDLLKLYEKAKIVFLGSPYDPGPHTFLEAQSFGAIVINGIKEGGARETFIEGKTGFNIAYKDSFALAEKILFILRNRDIALKMSLDAFENIQKNWKWEYVADRIAQAITDTWDK